MLRQISLLALALPLMMLSSCSPGSDGKKDSAAPASPQARQPANATQAQLVGYWRLEQRTAKKDALGKFRVLRFISNPGVNQVHFCSSEQNGSTNFAVNGKTLTFTVLNKRTLKPTNYKADITMIAKDRLELNHKLVYDRFTPKAELTATDKSASLCK